MRRVTMKGIAAHKLRLALTALAIVLGVTFISGTFVLTDTLNSMFSGLIGNVYSKLDFEVRGVAQFSGSNAMRNPLPESLLSSLRRVPGVADAQGLVEGYAQYVARDGKPISTGAEPTLGVSYDPDPRISDLHIVQGGPPVTNDDVVMDAGTAQQYGFSVGQRVRMLFYGQPRTFTISGIAQYGTANGLAGVTLAAFNLPTAQQLMQETGQLDAIDVVTKPGVSKAVVEHDIARILPPGVQVVTGATLANEATSSVNQSLTVFSTALLIFAFISLFVGAFTIYNTFSITVGQRTRELALLRVVGASRRQVFGSVLAEAGFLGLASSVVGIGLGVLAAAGLEALLRGFGVTLPAGSLVFEPRTAVVGLAVGVGVTVISAIWPARRAVQVPPVAAITERQDGAEASLRRRLSVGAAVAVAGAALLGIGLTRPAIQLVGLGAAAIFVGVAMLAPAVARPVAGAIGRPLARIAGTAGKLGRRNSMRSPRRTAQTAAALTVGLALVCAMAVFGASLSKSATSDIDQAISADLIVSSTSSLSGLAAPVPGAIAHIPGVADTNTLYSGPFEVRGSVQTLTGTGTRDLASTVMLRMTAGSSAALAKGELLIDSTTAIADHLTVGDTVAVKFAKTGATDVRIGGIYQANALIGSYLVSDPDFLAHFGSDWNAAAVLVSTNGSVSADDAVSRALAAYPTVQVQTRAQFEQASAASVNQLLGLVYALLALAVLIALIGIVNTLMLSVFERTREIGLMRAVGMRRSQVKTMVRSEAVILAVFGAVIGIVVGTGLGLALVESLKHKGITETAVPVSSLVVFLVLAALLGLLAATWPARRAAKLDVLAAIAAQ
jgi:putative ABC transport system permease protein